LIELNIPTALVGSTFFLELENEAQSSTNDSTTPSHNQETPKAPSSKRKHRKLPEMSVTDSLLQRQVDLVEEQIKILKDVRDLMKERNELKRESLSLKRRRSSGSTGSTSD